MASSCAVQVKLELGHRAQVRKKPTVEGFTHDWMVFVRGPEHSNIQHFVEKVVFHLHESFPRPKRACLLLISIWKAVDYFSADEQIKQICGCKLQFSAEVCKDFHKVLGSLMPTRIKHSFVVVSLRTWNILKLDDQLLDLLIDHNGVEHICRPENRPP
ncbi:hypothetical protein STEG23_026683 [Scotinomys teguina]